MQELTAGPVLVTEVDSRELDAGEIEEWILAHVPSSFRVEGTEKTGLVLVVRGYGWRLVCLPGSATATLLTTGRAE